MPKTLPVVNIGDIVRVVNHGSRPLRLMWDSKRYEVAIEGFEYMPFECAKLYFGDPRSTDNVQSVRDERGLVGFVADRPTEVRRLRLLWDHPFGDYVPGEVTPFDDSLIPHVEVFTVRGERVYTILDDPEGTRVLPAKTTRVEANDMQSTLIKQGQLIQVLMERLGMDSTASIVSSDAPPIEPFPEPTSSSPVMDAPQPKFRKKMFFDQRKNEIIPEPDAPPPINPSDISTIPEVDG